MVLLTVRPAVQSQSTLAGSHIISLSLGISENEFIHQGGHRSHSFGVLVCKRMHACLYTGSRAYMWGVYAHKQLLKALLRRLQTKDRKRRLLGFFPPYVSVCPNSNSDSYAVTPS